MSERACGDQLVASDELVQEVLTCASWIMHSRSEVGSCRCTKGDLVGCRHRWTESIAQKVKRKKKVEDHSKKEIWRSVFDPPVIGVSAPSGLVSIKCAVPPRFIAI
jgi:hypothetical protein